MARAKDRKRKADEAREREQAEGVLKAPGFRPFAEAAAALRATVVEPAGEPKTKAPGAPAKNAAPVAGRPVKPPPSKEQQDADDAALFAREFAGVRPLEARTRERVKKPQTKPASSAPPYDEDAETLAKLAGMVEGVEPLGAEFSEEHTEWIADDADPGLLPRLVAGEFPYQAHLDLHGMTREGAHEAVIRFLAGARVEQKRCVLLVHGRGNHSEDSVPVIKLAVQRWLRRGILKDWVFAYASALPNDGGAGAMYVLIRRTGAPAGPDRR
jgi:DNA-nicking Smr family endonuclease